jgi:hypothetical protein
LRQVDPQATAIPRGFGAFMRASSLQKKRRPEGREVCKE